ncbi:uncharacterized protein LOC101848986 [Aplysia californica]|uniref:Uncharacterized protein LOC101848986 n=1 Tax=Aplysia californica TaxID=6500 RepID=A0ABM0JWU6_APLCA|nr:uncharacterized protein LOC101848986 [Aplysia californica]XP_035826959.1 uncharacterized protein LOC101848986 [Aplysia californica]
MMAAAAAEEKPAEESQSSPGFFMKTTISSISLKFPSVKNLSTSNLDKMLKDPSERGVVLLDARPQEEYNVSHLEDAKRVDFKDVNMEELSAQLASEFSGKPNPTVVCYCSVGYRSSVVAKNLQEHYKSSGQQPVPEIYNLAGSLFQWANERRPMVDMNGQKTQFAHPYSVLFGKLLDAPLRKSNV